MQTAYTAKAKKAIDIATRISKSLHHSYIGTEHILLGLLKEGTGVASQVLADNGVEYDKVLELIEELIAPGNVVAVLRTDCPRERRMCLRYPKRRRRVSTRRRLEQNTF